MTEDSILLAAVRGALECSRGRDQSRIASVLALAETELRARRQRRLAWRAGGLLAASIGAVVLSSVLFRFTVDADSPVVDGAIALLCEMDGVESIDLDAASSSGDLLLAWQDAPCGDLL